MIVGPGRVGLALGKALLAADAVADLCYMGRHPEPPGDPIFDHPDVRYRYGVERPGEGTSALVLAVPDDRLEAMAELIAARGAPPPATPALHCSGALGAEPLGALHHVGYRVGTLHPLQTIVAPNSGSRRLRGASFAVSGQPEAMAAARRIVHALGGEVLTVPTRSRPSYHAAAVMASSYVVVLLRQAVRLLQSAGMEGAESERAILDLARGALDNAGEVGLAAALTGPAMRGDVDVIDLHFRTLPPDLRPVYALLGRQLVHEAADDIDPETTGALLDLLERYS